LTFGSIYAILILDKNYSLQGLKTEGKMLIPETSDNRKEVREATSEDKCNNYLKDG
jgi:hypothetical protein